MDIVKIRMDTCSAINTEHWSIYLDDHYIRNIFKQTPSKIISRKGNLLYVYTYYSDNLTYKSFEITYAFNLNE